MNNKVFISTSIPYVNGDPHIGHCLEFVQADVLARYYRQQVTKEAVLLLSGTDENALKNVLAAKSANKTTSEYVKEKSDEFYALRETLNILYDDFIRTTEDRHVIGASKLWESLDKDDIYKSEYTGKYCVGCEEFKTDEELVDGLCPEHNKKPEEVTENNYFFKLSKYQNQIEQIIENDVVKIVPQKRKNEVLAFIRKGLHDFSISRSFNRASGWGIEVPGDKSQIIYVWIDALSNYITALGYGTDDQKYRDFWENSTERIHIIGKGILKFHAIYWIGMLLSAKLPLPTQEYAHGYVTVEGRKIGKSLGNAIHPKEIVSKYGVDAFRYYVLREIPSDGDGDFSFDRLKQIYESELQNGLGNLVARVAAIAKGMTFAPLDSTKIQPKIAEMIAHYQFDSAIKSIWEDVRECNFRINEKQVWKLPNKEKEDEVTWLVTKIRQIGVDLLPFLPKSANAILEQYCGTTIVKNDPLFPRIILE